MSDSAIVFILVKCLRHPLRAGRLIKPSQGRTLNSIEVNRPARNRGVTGVEGLQQQLYNSRRWPPTQKLNWRTQWLKVFGFPRCKKSSDSFL